MNEPRGLPIDIDDIDDKRVRQQNLDPNDMTKRIEPNEWGDPPTQKVLSPRTSFLILLIIFLTGVAVGHLIW